ncbi:hypothetical protein EUZ85_17175 [Hahella sp. KA22]|uniref:hypothetical protein n=1 Tax=Hahella sp. KA22 TaxID=1628392 RepID=UPI000FDECBB7|nr:hypothetical protein [Hahella sp. KA22]AZZ92359.1 hypothetical protein ENC22_14600 [Hahella sp. KA22]QAY55732.1 hypothetical protein EUZ85_17175 [Hahella sp. KA22]
MKKPRGALTLAEGRYDYKTNVSLALDNDIQEKDVMVRTCLHSFEEWRATHHDYSYVFPFIAWIRGEGVQAGIVDSREVWVFQVDATRTQDIIQAVRVGMFFFNLTADDLLRDVYVKNLDVGDELGASAPALVNANRTLYENTGVALREAAGALGCGGDLNFWIYSHNNNPRMPQNALHEAVSSAGARSIVTDSVKAHWARVGNNQGDPGPLCKSDLHRAIF